MDNPWERKLRRLGLLTVAFSSVKFVASKTKAALDGGLGVILCCGETLDERESKQTIDVVTRQLQAVVEKTKDWSKIVIAYEPVWYACSRQ